MRCAFCLKQRSTVWRMNEVPDNRTAVFSCEKCRPDFWERFITRQAERFKRLERTRPVLAARLREAVRLEAASAPGLPQEPCRYDLIESFGYLLEWRHIAATYFE